jgi:hypothetical protein
MNTEPTSNAQDRVKTDSTAPLQERTLRSLLGYTDAQLAVVDPLEMNLLVAKEIPSLAQLDIAAYKRTADGWARDIKGGLRQAERQFHQAPQHWKNDLAFFRLGYLHWYVEKQLGVRYREDQRDKKRVFYINPSDLFLNGVMDSRQGTCASMATLQVVLGWRLGWPVSLACIGSHCILRYDNGKVTHNIEATQSGFGGFKSDPDDYLIREHKLSRRALMGRSDLRALNARELLGLFVALRARYWNNTEQCALAEQDYLLARYLFPGNHYLFNCLIRESLHRATFMFEPCEKGHPIELLEWLRETLAEMALKAQTIPKIKEVNFDGYLNMALPCGPAKTRC